MMQAKNLISTYYYSWNCPRYSPLWWSLRNSRRWWTWRKKWWMMPLMMPWEMRTMKRKG